MIGDTLAILTEQLRRARLRRPDAGRATAVARAQAALDDYRNARFVIASGPVQIATTRTEPAARAIARAFRRVWPGCPVAVTVEYDR